jgi:hypothetical protein
VMYLNPFRAYPAESGIAGNRNVYGSGVRVGNSVYRQRGDVRKRDILRAIVRPSPEHGLSVLRESI